MSKNNRRLANEFSSYLEREKTSSYRSTTYSSSYGDKYKDDECMIYFYPDADIKSKPIVFKSRSVWEAYKKFYGLKFKTRQTDISRWSEEYLSVYPYDKTTIACGSYSQTRLSDMITEMFVNPIKEMAEKNLKDITFKDYFGMNDLKELQNSVVSAVEC